MSDSPVRASGGVLWRPSSSSSGAFDVVLVHRPAYDDWSLPKGKAEPGESDEETARREVAEETGVVVELGPELPSTEYRDRFARLKVVRYWAMTPVSGQVKGGFEVDQARWLPFEQARQMLSYQRDLPVLDALPAALAAGDPDFA